MIIIKLNFYCSGAGYTDRWEIMDAKRYAMLIASQLVGYHICLSIRRITT
ncbi:protein of unknown function [Paenibacillus alvei]|uniref:Uncharacterized protein n=1 Tax=Paenibacillus alvei TaxID=44250 RepID=A0A383R903_PAEAL|nr:protein of unknown function [Paenibacillus alvei]